LHGREDFFFGTAGGARAAAVQVLWAGGGCVINCPARLEGRAMTNSSSHEVTELLMAWGRGDEAALEQLAPLIHAELYRLARGYMGRERPGHQLQTSALINEAYLRLIDWKNTRWQSRAHFFGVAAQMMRRILVDFARRRPRAEGGVPAQHVSLEAAYDVPHEPEADLVALDEALDRLAEMDPRKSRIVELRFFGGLSVEETAEVLSVSEATVMREWNKAKAWLYQAIKSEES
jgi:RNA polymerase sigma factor (TIGR02999 family)